MKNQIGKMKLFVLLCALSSAAVTGAILFPQRSAASGSLELLEVTGIFEEIDDTVTPNVITLNVDGERASGPLHEDCVFYDIRQRIIPRKGFVQLYVQKLITVEILEETWQVLSCRAGS